MALLELDPAGTEALIADHPEVTLAVYASPRQSVIAGPPEQVDALIAAVQQPRTGWPGASRSTWPPTTRSSIRSCPSCAARWPIWRPQPPSIPIITTTYDHTHGAHRCSTPSYWAANLRNPVRFSQAIATAGADHHTFVEISPHPLLTHAITDTLAGIAPPQRRNPAARHRRHADLPHQPQRHPHHPPAAHRAPARTASRHPHHAVAPHPALDHCSSAIPVPGHPLLGIGVTDPTNGTRVWESTLGPDFLWLGDHCVDDACVLPGAAYAELALAAVTDAFGTDGDKPWMIRELCLDQLMPITDATVVVTTLSGDESEPRVEIRSGSSASGWTIHATATLERAVQSLPQPPEVDEASATELDPEELYRRLRSAGQQHGPAFRGIVGLTVSDSGAARADVRLPSEAKAGSRRFLLHPVMVDIALQALGATKAATDLAGEGSDGPVVVLPVRFAGIRVYGDVTEGVCAVGTLTATLEPGSVRRPGDADRFRRAGPARNRRDRHGGAAGAGSRHDELASRLFALEWEPVDLDQPTGDRRRCAAGR